MERPAHMTRLPFSVELLRDGLSVGVDLDNGIDQRPTLVKRLNPSQIEVDQVGRAHLPGSHQRLKLGDGHLAEVARRGGGRDRGEGRGGQWSQRRCCPGQRAELEYVPPADARRCVVRHELPPCSMTGKHRPKRPSPVSMGAPA